MYGKILGLAAKFQQINWLLAKLYFFRYGLLRANKIFTHLTAREKKTLHHLALDIGLKPVAVEIGSYLGSSSCFIADAVKRNNGKLYCIDTWENQTMPEGERDTFEEFRKNTAKYKDNITPLRGWSSSIVEEFEAFNEQISLLFIDGDHSYEACSLDWELYSQYLRPNAIIVFHDTGWAEGVIRVIQESVVKYACKIDELSNMQVFRFK